MSHAEAVDKVTRLRLTAVVAAACVACQRLPEKVSTVIQPLMAGLRNIQEGSLQNEVGCCCFVPDALLLVLQQGSIHYRAMQAWTSVFTCHRPRQCRREEMYSDVTMHWWCRGLKRTVGGTPLLCLDLQAYLHVQGLRFQHVSAYPLRKTSGNTKDKSLPRNV